MKLCRCLIVILFLSLVSSQIQASSLITHKYDLPILVGTHSLGDQFVNKIIIPIDLKSTFVSVSKVELYIEGKASAGSAAPLKEPKEEGMMPVKFRVSFIDTSQPDSTNRLTPIAILGPLDGNFKTQGVFKPSSKRYLPDWSFLKKGTGELQFYMDPSCPYGYNGCKYITQPTATISKAVLLVEEDLQPATEIEKLGKLHRFYYITSQDNCTLPEITANTNKTLNQYILKHDELIKNYVNIWINLFKEKNKLSDADFDKHIDVYWEWNGGKYLSIIYVVNIDWFQNYDIFSVKVELPFTYDEYKDSELKRDVNLLEKERKIFLEQIPPPAIKLVNLKQPLLVKSMNDARNKLNDAAGKQAFSDDNHNQCKCYISSFGDPTITMKGAIDRKKNQCIWGTINVRTGEVELRKTYCWIE